MANSTIMKDRWFGEIIPNNANLNNYTNPGYYTSSENSSTLTNCPYTNNVDFYLHVEPNSTPLGITNGTITQKAYKYDNPRQLYYRVYDGSSWSNWIYANLGFTSQSSYIKKGYKSGTTSQNANIGISFSERHTIIGAYCTNQDDILVTTSTSADPNNYTIWLHFAQNNLSATPKTNTYMSAEYYYI